MAGPFFADMEELKMNPDESRSDPDSEQSEPKPLPPEQAENDDGAATGMPSETSASAQPTEQRTNPAPSTDAVRGGLSEEKASELIKLLKEILAEKESSPTPASADKLHGIVLQVVRAADAKTPDAPQPTAAPASGRAETPDAMRAEQAWPGIEQFAGGQFVRPETGSGARAGADRADVLPRIIIVVELANARAIVQEDRRESAKEMAAMLGEIAASEVGHAFFHYQSERR
jgi:hypothetical protein